MSYLKVALHWIFVSSSNPTEVSRTLQAATLALFAAWFPVLQLIHIPVDSSTITTVIVSAFGVLQAFLVLVGAVLAFVGIANKIVRSLTGHNLALNSVFGVPLVSSSVAITQTPTTTTTTVTPVAIAQDPTEPVVQ